MTRQIPKAPRPRNARKLWTLLDQVALVGMCRENNPLAETAEAMGRTPQSCVAVLDEVLLQKSALLRSAARKAGKMSELGLDGAHLAHRNGADLVERWSGFGRIIRALDKQPKEETHDREVT